MTLYLFNYNNYYNRRVLYLRELEEYMLDGELLHTQNDINFNPNDYVNTSVVLNYDGEKIPDYLLIVDDSNEIISRWYVIDSMRLRTGQHKYTLYRDLVAEYYLELFNAPIFVEKATLSVGNPLIYNNENMTYNQIKQKEYMLKDITNTPWLVGYIPRSYTGGRVSIPSEELKVAYTLTSLDQYKYNNYTTEAFAGNYNTNNANYRINFNLNGRGGIWTAHVVFNEYCIPSQSIGGKNDYYPHGNGWESTPGQNTYGIEWVDSGEAFVNKTAQIFNLISGTNIGSLAGYTPCHTRAQTDLFLDDKGKIIKVDNNYYEINIKSERVVNKFTIPQSSALGLELKSIADIYGNSINFSKVISPIYQCEVEYNAYKIEYIKITPNEISVDIPQDRLHLKDAPYDMFCMPLNYVSIEGIDTDYSLDYLKFAYTIAIELTQNNLFDFQLVPYCPLRKEILEDNEIKIIPSNYYTNPTEFNKCIQYIKDSNDIPYGAIFWSEQSSFERDLSFENISVPTDPIEFKVENECSFYRICSPNYNGVFEISATKNNGLGNMKAFCTYKPFTPYIKIAPEFNGLYGSNFGDARGLICGGDFSLPFITDSWKQYQVQNKNYQVMFDRQIENIEINNSFTRISEIANVITGTMNAAVTGGVAGGMVGGGAGAAAGAIGAGAASAIGGIVDVTVADKLREENLDYTKDLYGYQLGNIKALPQSLTKVSSYNIDNKIFPFVEFYTATSTEKDALRNKIKYNGMTVGTIGTIGEYFYQSSNEKYFKGKLIRIDNLDIDYYLARIISDELFKGVFI